jgi:hypothetical protein
MTATDERAGEDHQPQWALLSAFAVAGVDEAELVERFIRSAPTYRELAGLVRKNYWIDTEHQEAGGYYLFRDRDSLDAFVASDQWRVRIPQAWGSVPTVRTLQVPVAVVGPAA